MATWATVKKLGKRLIEVEESWYRTRVVEGSQEVVVRLRGKDVIVVLIHLDEKDALLKA